MVLLRKRHHKRLYRVRLAIARDWPKMAVPADCTIDFDAGWAKKTSEFSDFPWGEVRCEGLSVSMGASELSATEARNQGLTDAGVYITIVFESRSEPLANTIEEVLIEQGGKRELEETR